MDIEEQEEQVTATWDEVRLRLVPIVRDRYFFARPGSVPRVCLPLGDDLAIGIVIEDPKRMIYFSEEMLEYWEVSSKLVFTVACQNLFRRTSGQLNEVSPGVFLSPWSDKLDASRLALPHLFKADVKGKPVAVALSRNIVLVTGSEDKTGLDTLWESVEAARTRENFLSPSPMMLDTEWVPFQPENLSWRKALKAHRAELYRTQSVALEEHFKDKLHVALLLPVENSFHVTNWPNKPVTLLPVADWVTLGTIGSSTLQACTWADFRTHFASYLSDEVGFPARITAHGFPTPAELAAVPSITLPELLSRSKDALLT